MKLIVSLLMMGVMSADVEACATTVQTASTKCISDNTSDPCKALKCWGASIADNCSGDEVAIIKKLCTDSVGTGAFADCKATDCDGSFSAPLSVAMVFFGLFVRW